MSTFVKPNGSGFITPDDIDDLDVDDLYTVVAFDPGGTTGWATFSVYLEAIEDSDYRIMDNISFWTAGEFIGGEREQTDEMFSLVQAWPDAHIVVEDFLLRKFSTARELLSPVRMTARFDDRMYSKGDRRPIIIQPGKLAMDTVTDARMAKMGLYNPLIGQEHARDGVKHAVTWLKRAKKLYQQNLIASALLGDQ